MPLPIPNLDDRTFDDLVAEAQARLINQVPELTQIAPGDPLHALVDLFAWMTESVIFRANLITERQRHVFLNLLKVPLRPAVPAHGLLSIDVAHNALEVIPVSAGTSLRANARDYSTATELEATPLRLNVVTKELVAPADIGVAAEELMDQYELAPGQNPDFFRPRQFEIGVEPLSFASAIDDAYYLALTIPAGGDVGAWRNLLSGRVLNIGLNPTIPATDGLDAFDETSARRQIKFELLAATNDDPTDPNLDVQRLPLEVIDDTTEGATRGGIVRLRLPHQPNLLQALQPEDPMYWGFGSRPPELTTLDKFGGIVSWLRLSTADDADLPLSMIDVNCVEVSSTKQHPARVVAIGDGQPNQVVELGTPNVVSGSLRLEVQEDNAWHEWLQVQILAGRGDTRVFALDAAAGTIHCGDGVTSGARFRDGARIRATYQTGAGTAGNAEVGEIAELVQASSQLVVRQDYPIRGGVDAETLTEAEQRIPRFLTHRNRAVTHDDFKLLTLGNPVNPVARCEVTGGFIPGNSIDAIRRDVPGAVSVFVMPPLTTQNVFPRANQKLLRDVYTYLSQRTVLGTELYVLSPEYVRLGVGVSITLVDNNAEARIHQLVQTALREHLWPLAPGGLAGEGWSMGRDVVARELATQVARVDGVKAVEDLALYVPIADLWERVERIEITDYQLPQLDAVVVSTGGDAPQPVQSPLPSPSGIPTPIIPDLC